MGDKKEERKPYKIKEIHGDTIEFAFFDDQGREHKARLRIMGKPVGFKVGSIFERNVNLKNFSAGLRYPYCALVDWDYDQSTGVRVGKISMDNETGAEVQFISWSDWPYKRPFQLEQSNETFSPLTIDIDVNVPMDRVTAFLDGLALEVSKNSGELRLRPESSTNDSAVDAEFIDLE